MPIICLDYDGSYNRFPELFDVIIKKSKSLGYDVIMATMRYEGEKDSGLECLEKVLDKIIYTNRKSKKDFLESIGIKPDIWIDDNPKWILNDAN